MKALLLCIFEILIDQNGFVMSKRSLLFLLLFCSSGVLLAQEYLGNDLEFFQKKSQLYDRWLDAKGLGNLMEVERVGFEREGYELGLILKMKASKVDSAIAVWPALKAFFAKEKTGKTFEEILFDTYVRMMEIPAEQGNIQVLYPSADGIGYDPCFKVYIWKENGEIKHEEVVCKGQELNIQINAAKVKLASTGSTIILTKSDADAVFDAIIRYARERYEGGKFQDQKPKVQSVNKGDYRLSFVVNNLRREVLTNEKKSLWCEFVELWWGECNDMRRERLEFAFNFIPTQEGFLLTGNLTGKFGSGIYKPRISGYMDMEPDFEEDFLVPYVEEFQNDLKQYLER